MFGYFINFNFANPVTSNRNNLYNDKSNLEFQLDFTLVQDQLPYFSKHKKSQNKNLLKDQEGIPVFLYRKNQSYHPVHLAQEGLRLLNNHLIAEDKKDLDHAVRIAHKLIDIGITYKDTLIFPYQFDFPLHGYRNQLMKAPWYSAMAQGLVLSFFSRLAKISNQSLIYSKLKPVRSSFLLQKGESDIWFACTDEFENWWLEEYPMNEPNFTLNGFIFAILGLYDYLRLNPKDKEITSLLKESLKTLLNVFHLFRVKNAYSYYCRKHKIKIKTYHKVHIEQFQYLYKISLNKDFLIFSELLEKDYHKSIRTRIRKKIPEGILECLGIQ